MIFLNTKTNPIEKSSGLRNGELAAALLSSGLNDPAIYIFGCFSDALIRVNVDEMLKYGSEAELCTYNHSITRKDQVF